MIIAKTTRDVLPTGLALILATVLAALSGCAVPQPLGQGRTDYKTCRTTDRPYYLYVPKDYNSERRYPLVLSLHGMKPYDYAEANARMWGALADKYGFIIVAPILQTSDSMGQFPLTKMGAAENKDVQHIMACMDEVITDWGIDQNAILLSSWSMGGYLAHYIACEYGNRFTAFAPLQSNFSNTICQPGKARQWANRLPIFIFYGTADFPAVTGESKDSVEWWSRQGFNVQTKHEAIGHERHPELAAEFFERVLANQRRNIEIVITPPGPSPAPLAVNLWPALSSKIGEVRTYIWDFGKLGGPSYLKSPNVLIRQPGEYPISLTVVDKAGQRFTAETRLKVPVGQSVQGTSVAPYRTP